MGRMTDWIRDGRLAEAAGGAARPGDRPGDDLRLDGDAAGAQGALRGARLVEGSNSEPGQFVIEKAFVD